MTTTLAAPRTDGRRGFARLLTNPDILCSVVAPIAAYQVLHVMGTSDLTALTVAAVFPAVAALVTLVRTRRLDALALLSLAAVATGLVAALLLHDPRLLLVKDSMITGAVGLGFLGSLLASRPLTYRFARRFASPATATEMARRWETSAAARRGFRLAAAVWGVALIGEAALRVGLSYMLPTATLVTISPLLAVAVFVPVIAWTVQRRRAGIRAER